MTWPHPGRVVILTGTGVSVAACGNQDVNGFQVATWTGLLQHGVKHCRDTGLAEDDDVEILARKIDSGKPRHLISAAEDISQRLNERGAGVFRGWLQATNHSAVRDLGGLRGPAEGHLVRSGRIGASCALAGRPASASNRAATPGSGRGRAERWPVRRAGDEGVERVATVQRGSLEVAIASWSTSTTSAGGASTGERVAARWREWRGALKTGISAACSARRSR